MNLQQLTKLKESIKDLYKDKKNLLFHGWHHINFVAKKSKIFSESIGANTFLVESAALVHDLNYIVKPNSEPEEGTALRSEYLTSAGYSPEEIKSIENIIMSSHTKNRNENISLEAKALSDADTLFKALPITPIVFASKYIQENKVDIARLAKKVCVEQIPLMEKGIYFYTDIAKGKYMNWAKTNIQLWKGVQEALEDEDIKELLREAKM